MKRHLRVSPYILALSLACVIAILPAMKQKVEAMPVPPGPSALPVGAVVPFLLGPDGIEKLTTKGWAVADGTQLDDDKYELDNVRLPDLRGKFISGAQEQLVYMIKVKEPQVLEMIVHVND